MAYIGKKPSDTFRGLAIKDSFTGDGSTVAFDLTREAPDGGDSDLEIFIDNVRQEGGTGKAYTLGVDGSGDNKRITFTAAPDSGAEIYIINPGKDSGILGVGDGTVTAAKIASDAVTTTKILDNNVTVAKLPTTLDISGNTVTLPASVSGLGTGITNAQLAGSIDVTSKITGVVPSANLGSGTGSSANFLRGDSSWQEVATGTSWQSVVTASTLTAVAGRGYPINTTSNACTVTLPAAASVGDTIEFTDYARNWGTNAVTFNLNSLKYQGNTTPVPVYDTNGESISITYMDSTKGWVPTSDGAVVFETAQSYAIEWLVIGGGASGGTGKSVGHYRTGGGGGAGGYRNNFNSETTGGGGSETNTELDDIASGVALTIDVGAGGASVGASTNQGLAGEESSIKGTGVDITSDGGGGGGANSANGSNGASGGGAGSSQASALSGGTGTANQGYAGGDHATADVNDSAGGGGAGAVGDNSDGGIGDGGAGLDSSITGASVGRGGGGGGGNDNAASASSASHGGGIGGWDAGDAGDDGDDGDANTGGGGGGAGAEAGGNQTSGAGGSGVVILRMPDANYSGTTTGSPTVAQGQGAGSDETIITFNADGSYTT